MFNFGTDRLTASNTLDIVRKNLETRIAPEQKQKIIHSHHEVLKIVEKGEPVYGINTGFGPLCNTIIDKKDTTELQKKLILSHSVGVGDPISEELSKLMLVLKVHALCQGYSGIDFKIIERILWHIDNDIIPVVPSQGSVGASGDLAPLAHLFLSLLGEGYVFVNGQIEPTNATLIKHNLKPLNLSPKAGLALINGTQFIAAHAVLLVEKLKNCLDHADLFAAMMIEGLQGSMMPFHPDLHKLRPFGGNQYVADRIYQWLQDSEIMKSHENCDKVQDPYSLRCVPQVHGASRNAWLHLKESVETEINAVTDNPIIFSQDFTISGGNFHGQPLALPIDYACLAASEVGNISDRRSYLSLEGKTAGVPKLLMEETGTNSGFMILQYTSAALASENKGLCFPSSADSIPTSLGQEDHVSMGSIGGRKALRVCENVEKILAVELICAAQAMEFQRPLNSSPVLELAHKAIREKIPYANEDRIFADDINKAIELIKGGTLVKNHHSKSELFTLYGEY